MSSTVTGCCASSQLAQGLRVTRAPGRPSVQPMDFGRQIEFHDGPAVGEPALGVRCCKFLFFCAPLRHVSLAIGLRPSSDRDAAGMKAAGARLARRGTAQSRTAVNIGDFRQTAGKPSVTAGILHRELRWCHHRRTSSSLKRYALWRLLCADGSSSSSRSSAVVPPWRAARNPTERGGSWRRLHC